MVGAEDGSPHRQPRFGVRQTFSRMHGPWRHDIGARGQRATDSAGGFCGLALFAAKTERTSGPAPPNRVTDRTGFASSNGATVSPHERSGATDVPRARPSCGPHLLSGAAHMTRVTSPTAAQEPGAVGAPHGQTPPVDRTASGAAPPTTGGNSSDRAARPSSTTAARRTFFGKAACQPRPHPRTQKARRFRRAFR